jgi:hypothetical protein
VLSNLVNKRKTFTASHVTFFLLCDDDDIIEESSHGNWPYRWLEHFEIESKVHLMSLHKQFMLAC